MVNSAASMPPVRLRTLLLTVALGSMLAPLNSTMIAVALPNIAGSSRPRPPGGWSPPT